MSNSTITSLLKTWMGFTRGQAVVSLATTWGTGSKETENRQLTNQRTSCLASSRCPMTLSWRRRCWFTLGHHSSQNLEELSVFFLACRLCRCGMVFIWLGRGCSDICQKRTQTLQDTSKACVKQEPSVLVPNQVETAPIWSSGPRCSPRSPLWCQKYLRFYFL